VGDCCQKLTHFDTLGLSYGAVANYDSVVNSGGLSRVNFDQRLLVVGAIKALGAGASTGSVHAVSLD